MLILHRKSKWVLLNISVLSININGLKSPIERSLIYTDNRTFFSIKKEGYSDTRYNIMLSEISQSQQDKYCVIPFI